MKKIVLFSILAIISMGGFAQGFKAVTLKGGFQTNASRLGAGLEGHYYMSEKFRFSPEIMYYFPHEAAHGLDLTVNANYLLQVDDQLMVYPIAGISMVNNRYSKEGYSYANSDFGVNLGMGSQYNLNEKMYASFDARYMFNDHNCMIFMLGIGIRLNK